MTIDYIHRFITSMAFTALLETGILVLLLRTVFRRPFVSTRTLIQVGLLVNFATIPYVWFVFPYVTDWPRETSLLFSEPFVFIVEAVVYRYFLNVSWRTAIVASFLCNVASYYLGPILRTYGLWLYW
ncbi:MAG: hypothetical protein JWO43_94 [Candidatus Adlerbacteria bacterium]|nr:hypothetical protein [Candidatus Adlerbacteria bacterium]